MGVVRNIRSFCHHVISLESKVALILRTSRYVKSHQPFITTFSNTQTFHRHSTNPIIAHEDEIITHKLFMILLPVQFPVIIILADNHFHSFKGSPTQIYLSRP